jgi:F0F1-type ATP synthase membrane subunit b/b'
MAKEIITNVEALDAETERILTEAKTRASEIILEAREEAQKILSSPLPLDAIRTECDTIVSKARAEADRKIRDSEQQAAVIRASADKRVKEIIERVVNIVRGQG